jgi:hypothetical protein
MRIVGLLALVAAASAPADLCAQGSNLGSYGKQFVPGSITGKVTAGGVPVVGARVETAAGQFATTNASGSYTLYVDAPGIYEVTVRSNSSGAGPVKVSVTMGAATTRNFDHLIPVQPSRHLPVAHASAGGGRP